MDASERSARHIEYRRPCRRVRAARLAAHQRLGRAGRCTLPSRAAITAALGRPQGDRQADEQLRPIRPRRRRPAPVAAGDWGVLRSRGNLKGAGGNGADCGSDEGWVDRCEAQGCTDPSAQRCRTGRQPRRDHDGRRHKCGPCHALDPARASAGGWADRDGCRYGQTHRRTRRGRETAEARDHGVTHQARRNRCSDAHQRLHKGRHREERPTDLGQVPEQPERGTYERGRGRHRSIGWSSHRATSRATARHHTRPDQRSQGRVGRVLGGRKLLQPESDSAGCGRTGRDSAGGVVGRVRWRRACRCGEHRPQEDRRWRGRRASLWVRQGNRGRQPFIDGRRNLWPRALSAAGGLEQENAASHGRAGVLQGCRLSPLRWAGCAGTYMHTGHGQQQHSHKSSGLELNVRRHSFDCSRPDTLDGRFRGHCRVGEPLQRLREWQWTGARPWHRDCGIACHRRLPPGWRVDGLRGAHVHG